MTELEALAQLSHGVERAALALAGEGVDAALIAHEIASIAAGRREVVAIALSYLLRRRALGGVDDVPLARAIDATVLALRRTRSPAAPPRGRG